MKLETVKGFNKLTDQQRELFKRVHHKHMATVEDKKGWTPVSVKWHKTYLKVSFINGEWLHYTTNGEWF